MRLNPSDPKMHREKSGSLTKHALLVCCVPGRRNWVCPSLAELCAEKVWKMMAWAVDDGDVPVLKALRFVFGWKNDGMVEEHECVGHQMGPAEFYLLVTQVGIP